MVDARISSGQAGSGKASVIRSEIRREPSATALCLCFCTLHTNEIPRTDPLVQVDYVRVVDLDIGASKSDIRAIRTSSFRSAPTELKPATAGWCRKGRWKTLSRPVVRR